MNMRAAKAILLSLLAFSSGSFVTPDLPSPRPIAIIDVTVIDVEKGTEIPHSNVVVVNDKLLSVGPSSGQQPRGAVVVKGKGRYLIPGLWDMHVHLADDARPMRLLLAAGITGARDMGANPQKALAMRKRIRAGALEGPRLFVAGPMLEGPPSEAEDDIWIIRTPEDGRNAVLKLVAMGVNFIKVHDHLSSDSYYAIAEAAKSKSIPFAGHVTEHVTPVEASKAGQISIEHFEFLPKKCMPLFDPQQASAPTGCDNPSLEPIFKTLAQNGTWLDPTVQSFLYFAPDRWPRIQSVYRSLAQLMRANNLRMLAGTDQSSYLESKGSIAGKSLHEELACFVEAGFTPAEALRAATEAPAKFFGLSQTSGTIEVGKSADLVLLDGDPLRDINNTKRIAAVINRGRLYDSTALIRLHQSQP
jgi:imidazolonepropionase-like amidohydrolase